MQFKVEEHENPNIKNYPKADFDIAYDFAEKMYKEFGKFVKCVSIFGSTARRDQDSHDIDVLVVVDDLMLNMDQEVVEAYRLITEQIVRDTSTRLHITSLKFTSFWEYVRAADPVAVNILRDGVAMIDTGFFDPLQALLKQGRIRPTPEAIWSYFSRSPATLHNSKWHVMQAALDLYWAVIDAAHAVLMKMGEVPPSPDHVGDLLEEKLVKRKLLDKRYVTIYNEFYKLSKMILHREIKGLDGQEFDKRFKEAEDFVHTMKALLDEK